MHKSFSQATINLADFTCIKTIGYGSHGESRCFKEKESNNSFFVFKQINNTSKSAEQIQRFKFQLNFPSLLRYRGIYKISMDSNIYFYLTEFLENGSLETRINNKTLNPTQKSIIIFGVAAALNFLHSNGSIHGHLFPSNIIFDKNNEPRVCDFGLYQFNQYDAAMIIILNKSYYIAPEYILDAKMDTKSDVYSFAMILYCLLTDQLFNYDNKLQLSILAKRTIGERPEFPESDFPDFYKNLIQKCWEKNPDNRPTFSDILTDFTSSSSFILQGSKNDKVKEYIQKLFPNGFQSPLPINQNETFSLLPPISSEFVLHNFQKEFYGNKLYTIDPDHMPSSLYTVPIAPSLISSLSESIQSENAKNAIFPPVYNDYYVPKPTCVAKHVTPTSKKIYSFVAAVLSNESKQNSAHTITSNDEDINQSIDNKIKESDQISNETENKNANNISSDNKDNSTNELITINNNPSRDNSKSSSNAPAKQPSTPTKLSKTTSATSNIPNSSSSSSLTNASIMSSPSASLIPKIATPEESLKVSADCGNIESQFKYGNTLLNGPNAQEGARYIKLAADSGHLRAQKLYSYLAKSGTVIPANRKVCDHYMKLAANSGDLSSQMEYAAMLESGTCVQQNLKNSAKFYHQAALQNDKNAQFIYGTFLETGKGVQKNLFEAVNFYRLSADQGHCQARLRLAELLKNEESAKYLKLAADADSTEAQIAYAKLLLAGDCVPKDLDTGIDYLMKAIELDNSEAMLILGCLIYFNIKNDGNKSDPKEISKGQTLIEKAGEHGNPRALFLHGIFKAGLEKHIVGFENEFLSSIIKLSAIESNTKAIFDQCWSQIPENENLDETMGEGMELILKAADYGLCDAQYLLGNLFQKNNSKHIKSARTATEYIKKAADTGSVMAQLSYALTMDDGHGIPQNLREAAKFYKMAADGGNIPAMVNYGFMLYDGRGINRNRKEAIKYMKQAADADYLVAAFKYAMMLFNGQGTTRNVKAAVSYFEKVVFNTAKLTSPDIRHASETSSLQMMQESARSIRAAAEQGFSEAQRIYATMLLRGTIFQTNISEAHQYFKKAAQSNEPVALCFVASQILINPLGDRSEAAKMLKIAADLGYEIAQFKYAMMAEDGDGVPQNLAEAAEYYHRAADKNLPQAQLQYGIMLEYGDGIDQNQKLAAVYYEKASESEPEAMINFGKMLKSGTCIEKDVSRARHFFRKAAKLGNKDGQYMYARMLQKGEGGEMDKHQAACLYKMAASQPFMSKALFTSKAQFRYAEMLERGEGVIINFKEATKYYLNAADFDEPHEMSEYKMLHRILRRIEWIAVFIFFAYFALNKIL